MNELIDFTSYPVSNVLNQLLKDKITGENIIFATNSYDLNGNQFKESDQITQTLLKNGLAELIQPRVSKSEEGMPFRCWDKKII